MGVLSDFNLTKKVVTTHVFILLTKETTYDYSLDRKDLEKSFAFWAIKYL